MTPLFELACIQSRSWHTSAVLEGAGLNFVRQVKPATIEAGTDAYQRLGALRQRHHRL